MYFNIWWIKPNRIKQKTQSNFVEYDINREGYVFMDYNLSFPFYLLIYFVYFIMINYSTYFGIPFFLVFYFLGKLLSVQKVLLLLELRWKLELVLLNFEWEFCWGKTFRLGCSLEMKILQAFSTNSQTS